MGAGQAYHWAALFPTWWFDGGHRVRERADLGRKVFLSGLLRRAAAPEYRGGRAARAEPVAALRAFRRRIYAAWGLSQDFYRERLYETALGAPSLTAFLKSDWEDSSPAPRAANLYAPSAHQEASISTGRPLRRRLL